MSALTRTIAAALNPDEMSVNAGDVVTVLNSNDPDWWRCELRGNSGVRVLVRHSFVIVSAYAPNADCAKDVLATAVNVFCCKGRMVARFTAVYTS